MEGGALLELALHLDLAAVFLNNAVDDGQPEACSVVFGGEKGIEDVRNIFTANALAIIANGHAQHFRRVAVASGDSRHPFIPSANLRLYAELPAAIHRVHGIEEKIKKHLLELIGIGPDCIDIGLPRTS